MDAVTSLKETVLMQTRPEKTIQAAEKQPPTKHRKPERQQNREQIETS
jgi:hypothetical protein